MKAESMQPEPKPESLTLDKFTMLSNVEIAIMAELDHRKITFRELLMLDLGTVLVLTRPVGENIDVYVDRVLLGTGEILVVDDNLAVRLADLRDKPAASRALDDLLNEEQAA